MGGGHTVAAFDAELKQLQRMIEDMGRQAENQFAQAVAALLHTDTTAAAAVIEGDVGIDRLEAQVEAMAVRMLALRQPMARDLREIVAAFKVSSNLERLGDFARSIAKRTVTLASLPVAPPVASLAWMGETVQGMIHDVVTAYVTQDAALAKSVRERDSAVDHAYTALFREMLTYMMEAPQNITGCTHLLFVAKSIERAGDHVTNIAENICFLVEGRVPTEERAKDDQSSFAVVDVPAPGTPPSA